MSQAGNASNAFARGAMWSVTLRWFIKVIGLLSTVILARLLLPADYGVMAMASIMIGIVEIFLTTNADTALLRSPDASDAVINSAWTLRIIQSTFIAIVACALAPAAARFFNEPRVVNLIIALSVGMVVSSLSNIGLVLARKNLDFGLEVKVMMFSKVVAFVATVTAAYFLRSYWALVLGIYAGHLAMIGLSYRFHSFRPRWDISRIREIWSFSQWLLVSGIAGFAGKKLDEFVLGHVGTARELGVYNVASEIGQTATVEIGAPINRSLLPVLSSMPAEGPSRLALLFSTLGGVNTFTIPVGIGMCLLAVPFTSVVLGSAWDSVAPVLKVFAVHGVIRFLVSPYGVWFMVTDRTKAIALISWLEIAFLCAFVLALHDHGVLGLAWARLLTSVATVTTWLVLGRPAGLRLHDFMRSIARPGCATLVMAAALAYCQSVLVFHSAVVELATLVAIGAASYVSALLLVWSLQRRPDGVEKWCMKRLGLQS